MSPQAGTLLMEEVAPRLRAVVPNTVLKIGAEDNEELVQDGLAIAARMLDSAESRGKTVTAGNIAYYTILLLKSGGRSGSRSRADVMSPGAQLDHKSCVHSVEEEVGYDPILDEAILLGDLLSDTGEDPAEAAARNADWEQFLGAHDYRYGLIATALAEGRTLSHAGRQCGIGCTRTVALKHQMADDLREYLGTDAIADSQRGPAWKNDRHSEWERAACKAERRRA